jgi:hypothetical protein
MNYVIYALSVIDFKPSVLIVNRNYSSEIMRIHFELLEQTIKDVYKLLFKEDIKTVKEEGLNVIELNVKKYDHSICPCELSEDFNEFCLNLWLTLNQYVAPDEDDTSLF